MNCFRFLRIIKIRQVLYLQLLLCITTSGLAQDQEQKKGVELYGYIKTDIGYNFDQINPDWFDVMRVTKLPQYKDQFAPDGKIYFSARETRLGFNYLAPSAYGQLKVNFEFDLFGVGPDVGQTTFHFRKAYVELGNFSVGQNQSLFTDVDITPNTLDFGAPPARPFLRSIQIRYMKVGANDRWGIALEQPGATSDEGIYAERIELENVKTAFKLPNLTSQYRRSMNTGYVEVGSVLKWINWENTVVSPIDLSGDEIGWGFYLSSTQRVNSKTVLKGQVVYGKGMENYLTDAGPDVGIKNNLSNSAMPVLGVALPVWGGLIFLERSWNSKWSSTIGYSGVHIFNSDAQADNAFRKGSYGVLNLLYHPISDLMTGAEIQWGQRNNFRDDFSSSALRIQFSCKFNFSHWIHREGTPQF